MKHCSEKQEWINRQGTLSQHSGVGLCRQPQQVNCTQNVVLILMWPFKVKLTCYATAVHKQQRSIESRFLFSAEYNENKKGPQLCKT